MSPERMKRKSSMSKQAGRRTKRACGFRFLSLRIFSDIDKASSHAESISFAGHGESSSPPGAVRWRRVKASSAAVVGLIPSSVTSFLQASMQDIWQNHATPRLFLPPVSNLCLRIFPLLYEQHQAHTSLRKGWQMTPAIGLHWISRTLVEADRSLVA